MKNLCRKIIEFPFISKG